MFRPILPASVLVFSVACSTPGARPQDMTESGHEQAAQAHASSSDEHRAKYEADATAQRRSLAPRFDEPGGKTPRFTVDEYNPTAHHLASAEREAKMARDHAAAAAALAGYEEQGCAAFEPPVRQACPLMGQIQRVEELRNGVRLVPKAGVNAEAWQVHIACHLAFAQAKGRQGMEHCPLGLPGLSAVTAGSDVELTSDDAATIAKLQTLARDHLD